MSIYAFFNTVSDVPIQWANCSTWAGELSIEKVEANIWPPKRNQLLTASVSGMAEETIVYGNYNRTLVYRGYSLPSQIGPLYALGIQLPVHRGPLTIVIFNSTIPDVAPPGQYDLYINAHEQDNFEILCVKISWEL